MPRPLLSEQQKSFFDTFGFIVFRRLLPAREMRCVTREFDEALAGLRAAAPAAGGRTNLSRFLMDEDTPFCAGLGDDRRFADVAEELLDQRVLCIHVAGTYLMGDTPWHSDNADLSYGGVKFVCYLDALRATNGALRILPGSHRNPLWRRSGLTSWTEMAFGVAPAEIPAYVFDSSPGDVLAFQHRLWHASFHGGAFRRMLEVNFYADPVRPHEVRSFMTQMRRNHGPSAARNQQMYPHAWRRSKNARHRRWLRRLAELGALDTPVRS